jgi:hypothetical protein
MTSSHLYQILDTTTNSVFEERFTSPAAARIYVKDCGWTDCKIIRANDEKVMTALTETGIRIFV